LLLVASSLTDAHVSHFHATDSCPLLGSMLFSQPRSPTSNRPSDAKLMYDA
jgi:hypothetical protein